MTTVAYSSGVMAADTMSVDGGACSGGIHKIRTIGEWLVGMAGSMCLADVVFDDLASVLGRHDPPARLLDLSDLAAAGSSEGDDGKELLSILYVHRTHGVWSAELTSTGQLLGFRLGPADGTYAAIGSGALGALCAMRVGADPATAIAACIVHALETGGRVEKLQLPT